MLLCVLCVLLCIIITMYVLLCVLLCVICVLLFVKKIQQYGCIQILRVKPLPLDFLQPSFHFLVSTDHFSKSLLSFMYLLFAYFSLVAFAPLLKC